MDSNRLEIGKIVNTHGLRGDIKVTPWCDDSTVFEEIDCLYDQENRAYQITAVKYHKGSVILTIDGIDNINEAEKLKNKILCVDRETLGELPEGVYYIEDLIGLQVITDDGKVLGNISDCFQTGSNDVYVVKTELGKEILLPAIKDVIKDIDLNTNKMTVTLIEGLLEDEV